MNLEVHASIVDIGGCCESCAGRKQNNRYRLTKDPRAREQFRVRIRIIIQAPTTNIHRTWVPGSTPRGNTCVTGSCTKKLL